MGEFYLDIETTGLNPTIDKIITIQFQKLDRYTGEPIGELIILKEWESSEKEILKEFISRTDILVGGFNFIPVGYNLNFEHNFLKIRTTINNLPLIDVLNSPFIDLRAIGILMNKGQFKGSKLSNITGKQEDGINIPIWYENKDYDKIINYIENETKEFIKFNIWLYKKMPYLLIEFKNSI